MRRQKIISYLSVLFLGFSSFSLLSESFAQACCWGWCKCRCSCGDDETIENPHYGKIRIKLSKKKEKYVEDVSDVVETLDGIVKAFKGQRNLEDLHTLANLAYQGVKFITEEESKKASYADDMGTSLARIQKAWDEQGFSLDGFGDLKIPLFNLFSILSSLSETRMKSLTSPANDKIAAVLFKKLS
jgi:hypothetical protein